MARRARRYPWTRQCHRVGPWRRGSWYRVIRTPQAGWRGRPRWRAALPLRAVYVQTRAPRGEKQNMSCLPVLTPQYLFNLIQLNFKRVHRRGRTTTSINVHQCQALKKTAAFNRCQNWRLQNHDLTNNESLCLLLSPKVYLCRYFFSSVNKSDEKNSWWENGGGSTTAPWNIPQPSFLKVKCNLERLQYWPENNHKSAWRWRCNCTRWTSPTMTHISKSGLF